LRSGGESPTLGEREIENTDSEHFINRENNAKSKM
jgi:hypothetical protein